MSLDANSRSRFVTLIAWVAIILSGFHTFFGLIQNIMFHASSVFEEVFEMMNGEVLPDDIPYIFTFLLGNISIFIFVVGFAIPLCILIVSINLLRRKNWARILYVAGLALGIALTLYNVGSEIVWLGGRDSVPEDLAKEFSYSVIDFERINSIYLGISVFFVAIYSAIIWWLMRPVVVREFKV